ncbi:hypothetical protein RM844_30200 [Streptomyces sp. DSM 44915]|uniref:Uncharacterized protein n=1 Tax=Streptomyces chisholmiae TaxID=3075540 RepID=A0ABU2K0P6_9ACTN|nr:hypothetical protein [Streptomyces sp. DSM 44915]MDT0270553.1 hypothetical protein [Streptomyces sp. DSM 44915]
MSARQAWAEAWPEGVVTRYAAVAAPDGWRQRAAEEADAARLWTGLDGGVLSGRELADLVTRTREHLTREGWEPVPFEGIVGALMDVSGGDLALWSGAERLLELVLAARAAGAVRGVDLDAWERRTGRTWAQVEELLTLGAQFAREHGPQGGVR